MTVLGRELHYQKVEGGGDENPSFVIIGWDWDRLWET
jgi:hypothetical protein